MRLLSLLRHHHQNDITQCNCCCYYYRPVTAQPWPTGTWAVRPRSQATPRLCAGTRLTSTPPPFQSTNRVRTPSAVTHTPWSKLKGKQAWTRVPGSSLRGDGGGKPRDAMPQEEQGPRLTGAPKGSGHGAALGRSLEGQERPGRCGWGRVGAPGWAAARQGASSRCPGREEGGPRAVDEVLGGRLSQEVRLVSKTAGTSQSIRTRQRAGSGCRWVTVVSNMTYARCSCWPSW